VISRFEVAAMRAANALQPKKISVPQWHSKQVRLGKPL